MKRTPGRRSFQNVAGAFAYLLATRLAIAAALALTLRLTLLLALAVLLLLLLLLRTTTITTGCTDHGSGHLGCGVHLYSNARF